MFNNRRRNNKFLYNYLVNTLGLSTELVFKYVDDRLQDLCAKHLESKFSSNRCEQMILNQITRILEEGTKTKDIGLRFYSREPFESYVNKCIYNAVEKIMKEQYSFETKLVHKETNTVKKV